MAPNILPETKLVLMS